MNKQEMKAVITNFGAILISLFVKDKKGKGIQIIYGPQVTVIKSDFEETLKKSILIEKEEWKKRNCNS